MEPNNELFWKVSTEDFKKGYLENPETLQCLICSQQFTKGEIYSCNNHFYDARLMMQHHIKNAHSSMLDYLLKMNPSFLGLTEVQHNIITMISCGESDKNIAKKQGIALSTIRNHRYKLREKEKQARLYLTIMELLKDKEKEQKSEPDYEFCDAPKTASMLDDRYNITKKEKEKIIYAYFEETGALRECPAREKKKIVILQEIIKNFKVGKIYSETEINRILKRIYSDFPYIRRLLVEYGFLERTDSGEQYWVRL